MGHSQRTTNRHSATTTNTPNTTNSANKIQASLKTKTLQQNNKRGTNQAISRNNHFKAPNPNFSWSNKPKSEIKSKSTRSWIAWERRDWAKRSLFGRIRGARFQEIRVWRRDRNGEEKKRDNWTRGRIVGMVRSQSAAWFGGDHFVWICSWGPLGGLDWCHVDNRHVASWIAIVLSLVCLGFDILFPSINK